MNLTQRFTRGFTRKIKATEFGAAPNRLCGESDRRSPATALVCKRLLLPYNLVSFASPELSSRGRPESCFPLTGVRSCAKLAQQG
jgi:hypothetical protein